MKILVGGEVMSVDNCPTTGARVHVGISIRGEHGASLEICKDCGKRLIFNKPLVSLAQILKGSIEDRFRDIEAEMRAELDEARMRLPANEKRKCYWLQPEVTP